MPKTITVFKFSELTKDAQQKVIERYSSLLCEEAEICIREDLNGVFRPELEKLGFNGIRFFWDYDNVTISFKKPDVLLLQENILNLDNSLFDNLEDLQINSINHNQIDVNFEIFENKVPGETKEQQTAFLKNLQKTIEEKITSFLKKTETEVHKTIIANYDYYQSPEGAQIVFDDLLEDYFTREGVRI